MRIRPMRVVAHQRLQLLLVLIAAHLCTTATAEEVGDIYGGLTYSQTLAKDESSRHLGTFKPTTVGVGLSVVAIPNLALDGYVFTGLNDATLALAAGSDMTVNVKDGYGFNLRPYLSLSQTWGIYAKLGRQFGSQEATLRRGVLQTTTSTSYAHTIYGLGFSYNLDAQWGIGADYTKSKRIPSEQTNSSLISVGLRYKF